MDNIHSRHLKCGKCIFSTTGGVLQLARHLKEAHYKVEGNKCPHCDYSCQTLGKMVFHIKDNHGAEDVSIGGTKHLEELKFEVPGSEDKSNKSMDSKSVRIDTQPHHEETKKHRRKANMQIRKVDMDEKENEVWAVFLRNNYETHMKGHLENHIHEKTKEKTRDHLCDKCGVNFSEIYRLNRHLKTVHQMGEKYKCEQCHYESFAEGSVKRHFRAKHEKTEKN